MCGMCIPCIKSFLSREMWRWLTWNVYTMHKIFSTQADVEMVNVECRRAGIGCVDCKKLLAKNLNQHLEPFRARRAEFASQPGYVQDVLNDGAKRAHAIAEKTMEEVREAIRLP